LVAEVLRLRSIIGFEERTYADLKQALLASRDHIMGLSAQFGELRAKASWIEEVKPQTDRHIKNLERHIANLDRRLEETIEWANNVDDHSKAVQEWAEGVEAFNRNVAGNYEEIVAKATSYDALMRRPVVRVAAAAARLVRRRRRVRG
jgi:predicted  nucleic acid-binding Zn-ribbon protein